MNCTICGKPHSKEQPLTVIEDMVPIGQIIAFCPECLKEQDKPKAGPISRYSGKIKIGDMELPIERFEIT